MGVLKGIYNIFTYPLHFTACYFVMFAFAIGLNLSGLFHKYFCEFYIMGFILFIGLLELSILGLLSFC